MLVTNMMISGPECYFAFQKQKIVSNFSKDNLLTFLKFISGLSQMTGIQGYDSHSLNLGAKEIKEHALKGIT